MRLQAKELVIGLLVLAPSAAAQTTVTTTGGTANSVAKFSSSSSIVGSVITESGGNVGIGANSPQAKLQIGYASGTMPASTSLSVMGGTTIRFLNGDGNVNYGSYLVSADTAQLSLGTTYTGTDTIVLTANRDKIGIGTTTPAQRLDLVGWGRFQGAAPGNRGVISALEFYNYVTPSSNVQAQIAGLRGLNDYKAGQLAFYTSAAGSGTLGERMTIDENGNVGVGTTTPSAKLEVNGNVKLSAAGSSITFGDGTVQNTAWSGSLCGGDYAEAVDVSDRRDRYEPGDLLAIDPQNPGKFLKSSQAYSTAVAGVYSTKPGVIGRRQAVEQAAQNPEMPMAMVGIVPTKVSAENGPIKPGDILVSASLAGHAMKGTDPQRMMGAVLGKALGNLTTGTGVIEVLVSLQ